jgi:oligopeptidase B
MVYSADMETKEYFIPQLDEPKDLVPCANRRSVGVTLHGDTRLDEYFWLRERENPEVQRYLDAENTYTSVQMASTAELQEQLFQEMKGRTREDDSTVPEQDGEYFYYARIEAGKQYPIHCRKKGSLEAAEEVLLDENQLAAGQPYFNLGAFEISFNQRYLAYTVDIVGSEDYSIYIKDLETGELLPEILLGSASYLEWSNDTNDLFYIKIDDANRPCKLYRHTLQTNQSEDKLIWHEQDEAFHMELSKSMSKAYIFARAFSSTTAEVRFLNANNSAQPLAMIHPRERGIEYSVTHQEQRFLIRTNWDAANFRVMEAPITAPGKENWLEVVSTHADVLIEDIDAFKDFLIVYEREIGLEKIRIQQVSTGVIHYVEFPDPVYTIWAHGNHKYDSHILRFSYSSFVQPTSVFEYDMREHKLQLKKQEEILNAYDPTDYVTERTFANAADGAIIPISLVHKRGVVKDGNNPLMLIAYGAYGDSLDARFSRSRLSLLERGFVFAIAHVRGGQEMGRQWYEQGKLLNKRNTFTDFISASEYLIKTGYTSPEKLVIYSYSAGGLLVGAVVNMRPDLFKAAIADVPFVDALNTMLDPSLPLTITEYEEWGNPQQQQYYEYIKSYSPYDNIQRQQYPHMLVITGLHDTRVQYWEPAKYVAKLRAHKTDSNQLLLYTNMHIGHIGPSGRYEHLREMAFQYAFLFDVLGIK